MVTKKTQALATTAPSALQVPGEFTPEQKALIARTLAKDATPDELNLFFGMCKRTKLDPFSRQIYFIKDKTNKVMMQISVDGFRVIAERSGNYAGQDAPVWEDDKNGRPVKCSVAIYRWHGDVRYQAAVGVAYFNEYNRPGRDGRESNWDKLGHIMIAKVAECIALRKAFPNDLSGLYAPEEMAQAETTEHTTEKQETPDAPAAAPEKPKVVDAEIVEKGHLSGDQLMEIQQIWDTIGAIKHWSEKQTNMQMNATIKSKIGPPDIQLLSEAEAAMFIKKSSDFLKTLVADAPAPVISGGLPPKGKEPEDLPPSSLAETEAPEKKSAKKDDGLRILNEYRKKADEITTLEGLNALEAVAFIDARMSPSVRSMVTGVFSRRQHEIQEIPRTITGD